MIWVEHEASGVCCSGNVWIPICLSSLQKENLEWSKTPLSVLLIAAMLHTKQKNCLRSMIFAKKNPAELDQSGNKTLINQSRE